MKHKILKKEIRQLESMFWNHTGAAKAIGIDPRYYRRIRNDRGLLVGTLLRLRIDALLYKPDLKDYE